MIGMEVRKMKILENLEPKNVFSYFEEICSIPHGSKNTEKIADYLVEFAKEHHLKHERDEAGNVIIWKEASPGYEDAPVTMIQGHMDMVCAKNASVDHDFKSQGLSLFVEGDFIQAKGTSLGGDDGIAIAYALAILSDHSLKHPALEVVITNDEEIGMLGAGKLETKDLKSKYLLNIDSEEEGILLSSCAGGLTAICSLPLKRRELYGEKVDLFVKGLTGGHSGTDIEKGRGNANHIFGQLLRHLKRSFDFDLLYLNGGSQDNAIPREAEGSVLVAKDKVCQFLKEVEKFQSIQQEECRPVEISLSIYGEGRGSFAGEAMTETTMEKVLFLLEALPDGIQKMDFHTKGFVKTSLNLGVMETRDEIFSMKLSLRSASPYEKNQLSYKLRSLIQIVGGQYKTQGDYPSWSYNENSHLRKMMIQIYKEMFGKEPLIMGIHAGLECGILYEKMPQLDIVSFGPDILDAHSPRERMSIGSVKRTWDYLLNILENIKD